MFVFLSAGSDIQSPSGYELLREGKFGSQLYQITAEGSVYEDNPYLLNILAPTAYGQGFDTGFLLSEEIVANYQSLMVALFGDEVMTLWDIDYTTDMYIYTRD